MPFMVELVDGSMPGTEVRGDLPDLPQICTREIGDSGCGVTWCDDVSEQSRAY